MAGKDFNDRVLAAEVRTLALDEIKKILKNPKSKYYGPVLVKLAGGVLPRLNEVSGGTDEEGKLMPVLVKFLDGKNDRDTE